MIDDPRADGAAGAANDDAAPGAAAAPAPEAAAPGGPAEEVAALKDQLLRTLAELENTRRRARREVEDASRFAVAGFARDCLSVADNLARALSSLAPQAVEADAGLKALHEGVAITAREFAAVLERHGIKPIEALGERFDPNLHQAMFEVPTEAQQPGTVVQVMQAGFTLAGRLLRPALVGVAKAPDGGAPPEAQQRGSQIDTSA
jgi:molecular chaperone GrpE